MKTILFLISLIFCTQSVNSQTLKNEFFVNGIKTFSDFLYEEIKTDLRKDNFDTLCIESCAFVKFTITDKNVSNIRLSRFTPPVLVSSITRALNKTNGYWMETDSLVYLLPVIYVFENGCRPAIKSSGSILRMLIELSDQPDKETFPGSASEKPLKCSILNPLLLQYF